MKEEDEREKIAPLQEARLVHNILPGFRLTSCSAAVFLLFSLGVPLPTSSSVRLYAASPHCVVPPCCGLSAAILHAAAL